MKVLYISANDKAHIKKWDNGLFNVDEQSIYKPTNSFIIRCIRKIFRTLHFPLYIWFDDWYKNIKVYDVIIAIAYDTSYYAFRKVHKKYPNIRLILYYDDPVDKTISPQKVDDRICEKWSFYKKDAEKYQMRWNPCFYRPKEKRNKQIKYDIVYFGSAKGKTYTFRIKELEKIARICDEQKLNYKFGLLYSKNDDNALFRMEKALTIDEYTDYLFESKTLLDIVDEHHTWLTSRPLESVFYGKKLITNNIDIIDENFYNPNNIFIVGYNDLSNLKDFIDEPYKEISNDIKNYYSPEKWMGRFINEE